MKSKVEWDSDMMEKWGKSIDWELDEDDKSTMEYLIKADGMHSASDGEYMLTKLIQACELLKLSDSQEAKDFLTKLGYNG